jgi:hypothetical protein
MIVLERSEFQIEAVCTGAGNGGGGCGSRLGLSRSDLRFYPGVRSDSWGARDPAVSFKCEVCRCCTDLPKKSWPQNYSSLPQVGSAWYKDEEDHGLQGNGGWR